MFDYKIGRLRHKIIGHVFIVKQGKLSAAHIAEPGNAVNDGMRMLKIARKHRYRLGISYRARTSGN